MRIAYCAPEGCGSGHAVRGIALVQAAERLGLAGAPNEGHSSSGPGLSLAAEIPLSTGAPPLCLRAFGPPVRPNGPLPDLTGYEGSTDWQLRVLQWQPDLLIGDLRADMLEILRLQLGVPAWLLMRIWPREWREPVGWRVFAIEPGVGLGIRESVPPIVGPRRVWLPPTTDEGYTAGYNAWHEAIWYGYWDRVWWTDGGNRERRQRIEAGPVRAAENGADVLVGMAY